MIAAGNFTVFFGIYSYHINRGLPLTLAYAHLTAFTSVLLIMETWH